MTISISRIKLFKACRRAYWLKYVQGLEPVQRAEALQTGLTYHEKLAELYETGDTDLSDCSKESAMVEAYKKYIMPKIKVQAVEEWFKYPLVSGDELIGRIDARAADGRLVEHKTTGQPITEDYEYGLQWDEQILAYMLATGAREMWYTVCRKSTLRLGRTEMPQAFYQRMVDWYDDDTQSKIRLLHIVRTDEEVEAFRKSLQATVWQMKAFDDEVSFYRNPAYCTAWGKRCEYASVCLAYNPDEDYIEFTRDKERMNRNYAVEQI